MEVDAEAKAQPQPLMSNATSRPSGKICSVVVGRLALLIYGGPHIMEVTRQSKSVDV